MNNLFIIHSYNADTKESFGPFLENEAKKNGFNVIFPDFRVCPKFCVNDNFP